MTLRSSAAHLLPIDPDGSWFPTATNGGPIGAKTMTETFATDNNNNRRAPDRLGMATEPSTNWRSFAKNMTAERRAMLAKELKLPTSALEAIPLLGWINHGRDEEFYSFPEMNASGRVIGIMRRFRQKPGEKAAEKKAMLGGKRGLTIPIGWRDLPGPVFAPEGQSNSAARSACGLAAIGRPSNSGGVDFLEQLFRPLPADRSLILVGDNDKKPHSDEWPGKEARRPSRRC